ncbi:MAG: DUF2158 domain-containing protein [Saprospiraceae bacterium]|nr:DUF2158 domain-containing protein [Saprospiraceae bacterium]
MEKKFKIGEVVMLKSGSPNKTVKEYVISEDIAGLLLGGVYKPPVETQNVRVVWYENGRVHEYVFHQDLLEKVEM